MKRAFVIMPFDDKIADDVYKFCTKPICKEFDLEVQRADEIFTTNPILDDVIAAIDQAVVIIADISGRKANVFYELGTSHTLKRKQTIMITHEEYKGIPFDISHFRIIKYEDTISGKTAYENQLRKTLENILRDYKVIYRDDFELMIDVLLSAKKEGDLYALMSLTKAPKPLGRYEQLDVEGHNKQTGTAFSTQSFSVEHGVSTFIRLGYAEVSGDVIILTDKGKAFVELLDEKGFVCDFINGHILSENYVPLHKRVKQATQKQTDKLPNDNKKEI